MLFQPPTAATSRIGQCLRSIAHLRRYGCHTPPTSFGNPASSSATRSHFTHRFPPADLFSILDYMSREPLGNFELMVMLALIRAGDAAYGVAISKTIERSAGRDVLVGSV